MRRQALVAGVFACLVAIQISVFAAELAASFAEAVVLAEAQEKGAATKNYFGQTLLPFYGKTFAPVLQACFAKVPNPSSQSFAFVAAIDSDGHVLQVYRDHETNILTCLRRTLETQAFPRPPVSPYYLHVDMRFTDEPASASQPEAPPLVLEPGKYSYTFGTPKNWKFSFEGASHYGATLLAYPKDGNFDQSNGVMYVNELCAGPTCKGTLIQAIKKTIDESREDSPSLNVKTEPPILLKAGGEAQIRILTGARDPRQAKEALAFIEHDEAIILVVLTSRNTATWDQDYRAFEQVVAGHRFFTCNTPDLAMPCKPGATAPSPQ